MTMRHDIVDGPPVAAWPGDWPDERFEDRMRRIRAGMLHAAARPAGGEDPWFVVRVMSGREISVQNMLSGEGIEALAPMRMGPEYRRRHRVIPARLIPVMTGYVLVRFHASDEAFVGIEGVDHVIGLLGGSVAPHRIAHEEVNRFKALADDGSLDWERPSVTFRKGEAVRVIAGPFACLTGTVVSCRADGRGDAVVEMSVFSGRTPVLMPLAILERLSV